MNPSELLGCNPIQSLAICLNPMTIKELITLHNEDNLNFAALDYYYYSNMFRKHPDLLLEDTDDATVEDFLRAEQHAMQADLRFEALLTHPMMSKVLHIWRDQVRLVMGKYEYGPAVFTSGATTTSARGANPLSRFAESEVTSDLLHYMQREDQMKYLPNQTYKVGVAKASIVPKTAFIGRLIMVPCAINAHEQKRHGKTLSQRLREEGIDLSYAQDVHKRLAFSASLRGHLVTDDQKWASILVYRSLVRFLVAPEWYAPLSAARDKYLTMPDGSSLELAQFAGMGNGYCFELETIIFLGLLRTAAYIKEIPIRHKDIRVFGDDLIYPRELLNTVRSIGKSVGFITNTDKSFSEGPFRESCGGDYIAGIPVRPVYLKGNINNCFDLTIMANQLYQLYLRHERRLPLCYKVWLRIIKRIYRIGGRSKVLYGPLHLNCLHGRIAGNWTIDKTSPSGRWFLNVWTSVPVKKTSFRSLSYQYRDQADYVLKMVSGGYMCGYGAEVIPQQQLKSWQFGPPRPSYSHYPKSIPVPGTPYRPTVVQQQFFFKTALNDQNDPLSIFKYLGTTRCPSRIYDKSGYLIASEKEKQVLRRDLYEAIVRLAALRAEIVSQTDISDIHLDFT